MLETLDGKGRLSIWFPDDGERLPERFKSPLERFRKYAEKYGKPIYFGECGCTSSVGASMNPAAWNGGDYDGEEQANYLSAVVSTFKNEPWRLGLCWWNWDEQNDAPNFTAIRQAIPALRSKASPPKNCSVSIQKCCKLTDLTHSAIM